MPKIITLPSGESVEISDEQKNDVKAEVKRYLTEELNKVLNGVERYDSILPPSTYGYAERGLELVTLFTDKSSEASKDAVSTAVDKAFLLDRSTPTLRTFIENGFREPFLQFWQRIKNCRSNDKTSLMADEDFFAPINKYIRQSYAGDPAKLRSALAIYVAEKAVKMLPSILIGKKVELLEKKERDLSLEHQTELLASHYYSTATPPESIVEVDNELPPSALTPSPSPSHPTSMEEDHKAFARR